MRIGYALFNALHKLYCFIARPHTRGAKCVITCNGKILFVRLGYAHNRWTSPGGELKKNETFEQAARREILEETGITLTRLEEIGGYISVHKYSRDTVRVFLAESSSCELKLDGFEITEAIWASPETPPTPYARNVPRILAMIKKV